MKFKDIQPNLPRNTRGLRIEHRKNINKIMTNMQVVVNEMTWR